MSEKSIHDGDQIANVSCAKAFDILWFCPSPRSQINHYYREGELRSCAPHLSDWIQCLRSSLVTNKDTKEVNIFFTKFI